MICRLNEERKIPNSRRLSDVSAEQEGEDTEKPTLLRYDGRRRSGGYRTADAGEICRLKEEQKIPNSRHLRDVSTERRAEDIEQPTPA